MFFGDKGTNKRVKNQIYLRFSDHIIKSRDVLERHGFVISLNVLDSIEWGRTVISCSLDGADEQ